MRATWVFVTLSLLVCGPASAQEHFPPLLPRATATVSASPQARFVPLSGTEKWHYYFKGTYGPVSIARSVAAAGINQARNSTPEWGQGMEGYSKRLASRFGRHTIKESVAQGLGSLWHEDPRYFRSEKAGLGPRTLHAVTWTFIVRKDNGGYKFADARMIGTLSGAMVSRVWQPEGDRNFRSGLETAAFSLALDAGWNLFKEFWPDVRRRLRH